MKKGEILTYSDRLEAIRKSKKMSQLEFCNSIGIGQSTYSKMISRGSTPKAELLESIATIFPDVNIGYILTGQGEMFLQDTAKPATELEERVKELEEQMKEVRNKLNINEKL